MAFDAILWALQQGLRSTLKIVLIVLANRANPKTHDCFPSLTTIAKESGLNRYTVIRAVQELEELGFLERITRGTHSTSYTLLVNEKHQSPEASHSELPELINRDHQPVNQGDQGSHLKPPSLVAQDDPKQSIEPITETKKRYASALIPFGEFGRCLLTQDQHDKLKAKLNGNLEIYIDRFDRWADENPKKTANRKAYNTILNWFDRDMREGRTHGAHFNATAQAGTTRSGYAKYTPRQ